eukprot:scaffold7938_cov18-Prasinocladus_malaysianus.AAC.2
MKVQSIALAAGGWPTSIRRQLPRLAVCLGSAEQRHLSGAGGWLLRPLWPLWPPRPGRSRPSGFWQRHPDGRASPATHRAARPASGPIIGQERQGHRRRAIQCHARKSRIAQQ